MTALYLIGPRGAGKSSAGLQAAGMLGLPFVDTDRQVEQRAGWPVARIFAEDGEASFRLLERAVLLELLADPDEPGVVATGGGCVLDAEVRARLRDHPAVVWLTAPVAELRQRIRGSDRPPLTGGDALAELDELVRQREPLYHDCCSIRLETGDLSLQQVAAAVADHYRALTRTEGEC